MKKTPLWIWLTCLTCPRLRIRILLQDHLGNICAKFQLLTPKKRTFTFLSIGWATNRNYQMSKNGAWFQVWILPCTDRHGRVPITVSMVRSATIKLVTLWTATLTISSMMEVARILSSRRGRGGSSTWATWPPSSPSWSPTEATAAVSYQRGGTVCKLHHRHIF